MSSAQQELSAAQQELNLLIQRTLSNDASQGSALKWLGGVWASSMTLYFTLHHNWSLVGFVDRTVTHVSFVQLIQALKVNTTLAVAELLGAAISVNYYCWYC